MPPTPMEFKIPARRSEPIEFNLVGPDGSIDGPYTFAPPKDAVMVLPILDGEGDTSLMKSTFDWLGQGLSEEERTRIYNRLKDPEDDLTVAALSTVIRGLTEEVTNRPTT